ncbi:hypothetical protein J3D55_000201 [Chryseobacterium ginsenosidimutans]|uniref:hypothetical protein n=1 Tax=Chryseobacterium ginsenosidimutans TaxID=687846 RepID=UPI0021676CFA|nr:hypothetical protein [Chryseobacterium ginsenosidimutans]MCS3867285.1 hypothetical protein [Chryseobacterium ginsenosidimutans]
MNTTKNTIEYQIKKQIAEREITPSRDLWSEIEMQSAEKPSKTKVNWFLVAACLVLTFSLGAVLVFNKKDNDIVKPNVVAEVNNPKIQENIRTTTVKSPELIRQNQKESVAIENISPEKKIEIVNLPIVTEKKELPLIKENASEIASNISKIPAEKIIAQTDSAKSPVKRKKYVDPSTLLFSVEHKDVIEKTKQSNVATIDLNGK